MTSLVRIRGTALVLALVAVACARGTTSPPQSDAVKADALRKAEATRVEESGRETDEGASGATPSSPSSPADVATGGPDVDAAPPVPNVAPAPLHKTTREDLLALFWPPQFPSARDAQRFTFLAPRVGPNGPRFMNQGNEALARHSITKAKCLEGLAGITIQTDAQRAKCGGRKNMVPVYKGGDPDSAKTCIDVFEFPNEACELPMVWSAPALAAFTCESLGKRLCTQDEWNLACRADPAGGPDSTYAYGDALDLDVCNTNTPHVAKPGGTPKDPWVCNPVNGEATWKTCNTDTSPSGAYPKCRSRLGVFDQHGNVAEVMSRKEPDGRVVTQLKGSAFFYVDVAQEPGKRPADAVRETYPDHCNFDPRWHVETLGTATHVNYHLGFRCCAEATRTPK